jgi:hypothetical protein
VVGWARATVAGGAVDLAKTANTDGLAEVDVAGNGRGANVVPVDRLRWELLGGAGLDRVNPTCDIALASAQLKITSLPPPAVATEGGEEKIRTWDRELSLSLQESRVCVDELLRLHHNLESASFRQQKSFRLPRACSILHSQLCMCMYVPIIQAVVAISSSTHGS